MSKIGVSACSTDIGPPKKTRWYSQSVGWSRNVDHDIWCLKQGVPYKWEYIEHCAVWCVEFQTPEDLLAFKLTFNL